MKKTLAGDASDDAKAHDKSRFEALSDFRFRLRSFLRFSEDAARDEGVTVLQYQLMLHTQGFPGREWATVGEIAERLQAHGHGVVALVSRCEEAGLVKRKPSTTDRRQVEVHLTPAGRRKLINLAIQHTDQLTELADAVRLASRNQRLTGGIAGPSRRTSHGQAVRELRLPR